MWGKAKNPNHRGTPPALDFMFDKQAFELVADGDVAIAREIADLFREDSQRLVRGIRAALDSGSAAELRRRAHTLKSTCATVGASAASCLAGAIEEGGAPVATERLEALTGALDEAYGLIETLVEDLAVRSA